MNDYLSHAKTSFHPKQNKTPAYSPLYMYYRGHIAAKSIWIEREGERESPVHYSASESDPRAGGEGSDRRENPLTSSNFIGGSYLSLSLSLQGCD